MRKKNLGRRILALILAASMAVPSNIVTLAAESADVITDVTEEGNSGVDEVNDLPEADTSDDELEVIGIEEVEENTVPEDAAVQAEDVQAAVQSAAMPMDAGDGVETQATQGTKEDPYRVEVLNGKAKKSAIGDELKKIDSSIEGYRVQGTTNSFTSLSPIMEIRESEWDDSKIYELAKRKKNSLTNYESLEKYFQTKTYYNVDIAFTGDVPTGGGVSYNDIIYNTAQTAKVYKVNTTDVDTDNDIGITINAVDGYTVNATFGESKIDGFTYVPEVSGTLTVEYVKNSASATVKIATEGSGSVKINGNTVQNSESMTISAGDVTIAAEPTGSAGYVKDIIVNDKSVVGNASFSNRVGTYTFNIVASSTADIKVIFAERKINLKSDMTETPVEFNFYYSASAAYDTLKENVINAVVDSVEPSDTISKDNIKIQVYGATLKQYYEIDGTGWGGNEKKLADTAFKEIHSNNDSGKIKIIWTGDDRYPEITTNPIDILVKESRPTANIDIEKTVKNIYGEENNNIFLFDSVDEITNIVQTQTKATYLTETEEHNIFDNMKVTWTSNSSIPSTSKDGQTQQAVCTVEIEDTADYLGTTANIELNVCGKVHYEDISVLTNNEAAGTVSGYNTRNQQSDDDSGLNGFYNIVVTPNPDTAYYVENVTVTEITVANNQETTGTPTILSGDYDRTTFKAKLDVDASGATSGETYGGESTNEGGETVKLPAKKYVINVTYGERKITLKDTDEDGTYHISKAVADTDNFTSAIYTAAVETSNPEGISFDKCTITGFENVTVQAGTTYTCTITWNAEGKYPAVSKTVSVKITEDRTKAEIKCPASIDDVEYTADKALYALAKEVVAKKVEVVSGAAEPEYTVVFSESDPEKFLKQGDTATVVVKVSVDGNDTYLANEATVTVNIKCSVQPAIVKVESDDKGTVKLGYSENIEHTVADGQEFIKGNGTVTATATPNASCYIDSFNITNSADPSKNIQVEVDTNTKEYTFDVADGTGLAAGVQPKYTVTVSFEELTFPELTDLQVGFNPKKQNNYGIGSAITNEHLVEIKASIISQIADQIVKKFNIDKEDVSKVVDGLDVSYKISVGNYESYSGFSVFTFSEFGTVIKSNADDPIKCNATDTEFLKITWDASKLNAKYPNISKIDVGLTVYDARKNAQFKNLSAEQIEFTNQDQLIAHVEAALESAITAENRTSFLPNISYKNGQDVTIALDSSCTIPSFESDDTSAELTYIVTYKGDEDYRPAQSKVTFTATCKAAQCTVVEAENNNEEAGKVTLNGVTDSKVDGLSEVTVVVAPKDGYAVETITVTADNNETITVSNIIYECDTKGNRTASAKFTTGGKSGAVTYTVAVTYSEISMKLKSDQYLTYCYENDTDITANKMGSIVFAQIFESASGYDKAKADIKVEYNYLENYLENEDISNTIKNWVSTLLAPYQELTGTDGSLSVTETIKIPILEDWTLTNYHFGEYGTEKIRLTVDTKNPKYGSYTGEVQLTVYDSCYNNTIKGVNASAITSELEVNTKKDASGTEKYKQNTAYTITVTPDDGGEAYPSEIKYVKDIIVTDFEGKKVVGTLKHNKATDLIEGVTITKANSTFTFTTGSNETYTVEVVYGRLKMSVTDDTVTVKMYEGKTLTAEDLIKAAGVSLAELGEGDTTTAFDTSLAVKYSRLNLIYQDLSKLSAESLDLEKGTEVTFRFEYAGDDQHHAMGITKQITLKDTRTATEIKYTALAEDAVLDYVNHTKFEAELKAKLNAYVAAGDDKLQQDYEFEATAPAADTEEGKLYSTVTISYKGNDDYKPAKDVVFKVEVKEIPDDASVTVTGDAEKGTVTASGLVQGTIRSQETVDENTAKYTVLGENAYVFTVVPKSGYAVESIDVYQITEKDSAENEEEVSIVAQNTENTVETPVSAEVTYKDQTASVQVTLNELCNYIVKVTYVLAEFDFVEDAQYKFRIGIDTATVDDLYKEVVKAPGINTDEDGKFESFVEGSDRKVEYLARPTGTKLVITLPKIEFLGVTIYKGGDIEVSDLGELWLDPSEEVPVVTSEQITNEIMADLEEMMESIKDISDIGKLTKYMASINSKISSYAKYYGAHAFGAQETETLRVSYEDAKWLITEQQTKVTIVDPRIATTLQASAATVTYGATAAELLKAMNASILDPDGNKVDGTIEFITDLTTLNASETPYDVVIKFNGNEDYRPSETLTVQVTVNKAPCKLDITSPKSVVYGTDYDLTFATDPAGVEMIQFAVGLDVAEAAGETGATGFVQIVIPGDLGKILEGLVGDTELSLEEFVKILEGIVGLNDSILAGIGFDETTVEMIRTILEAVSDYMDAIPALRIKIGGELKPSNIGVYLVGAVTADSNYETAFDVDYLIITSKLEKFELEWDYDDANGIITNQSTKEEWFSLGAHAKEGTLESGSYDTANKKIAYLFLGVDKEGKFVFKDSSDGLGVGGYTQVAYTKDFGNTMYIAAPIARAFAIVPNIAKVSVGDDNHASLVTFDGQQHAMDVTVTTEAGTPITDLTPLTVTYVGYDANDVKIYNSTTPPTNAGTYTVYAVYADKEGERFGAGMGVLVIAPAESSVTVDDIVTTVEAYEENFGAVVTPEDCKYITVLAGISLEEDQVTVLNIDLPERLENLLQKYAPNMLNGISLNELLKATDSIKEKLTELGLDAAFIDEVINIIDQIPVTELGDVKVTFKDYAEVAPTTAGIYVLGAVTCDPNYKLAADTGILVLDPLVQVNFIDENGEVNHDRKFTYDGKSKAMDVKVTNKDGEELANYNEKYLTVTYVGYTTAGEKYNSTEAPTEAGAYAVTAVYKDTEHTLYGMAVGAMTILPAESELTVTDQTIVYGIDYALSNMIKTDPAELTYLTALAKVTDDSVLEVILPTELEATFKKVLEKTGLENITYADLLAKAEELKTYVENLNLDSELVDQILAFAEEVLDKADKATSIKFTFADLTNAATLTVGKYAVGAISTSTNHKVSADLGWLTVTPREIIVTVAPDSKTYGDADPTFTATAAVATGLVNGDKLASASVTRKEGETVGTYQFSIAEDGFQVTAADGTEDRTYCYTMKIADNNVFTINKKDVTVIIDCKSKVYGEADPEFTYQISEETPLVGEDTLDITLNRVEGEDVGEYAITAEHGKNPNYNVTVTNGADNAATFKITKKHVTVTLDSKSKVYGETDPEFTYQISEETPLVGEDTLDITLSREECENVGEYAITATVTESEKNKNYDVTIANDPAAVLAITPKAVTATVTAEKTYGEADREAEITVTFAENVLVNGDTAENFTAEIVRGEDKSENAGSHIVNATVTHSGDVQNYKVTVTNATLTINQKPVNAKVTATKVYGQNDSEANSTVTFAENVLVGPDTVADFAVAFDRGKDAGEDAGEDVAEYDITDVTTVTNANYKVTVTSAKLIIIPATINEVTVSVIAPVAEQTPQLSGVTNETGYTAEIVWTDAAGKAITVDPYGYNAIYTATITLTPDENHVFVTENLTVKPVDENWTATYNESGTYTLTKTYPATAKLYTVAAYSPLGTTVTDASGNSKNKFVEGSQATVTTNLEDGYQFEGWYKANVTGDKFEQTDEKLSSEIAYTFTVSGDTNLIAVFSYVGVKRLTISGDRGAYSVDGVKQVDNGFVEWYSTNAQVTLKAIDETREFLYWRTASDRKIVTTDRKYVVTMAHHTDLVPVYKNDTEGNYVTIEFVSDYNQVMKSFTYMSGSNQRVSLPTTPTKGGYVFSHWSPVVDGEKQTTTRLENSTDVINYAETQIKQGVSYVRLQTVYEHSGKNYTVKIYLDNVLKLDRSYVDYASRRYTLPEEYNSKKFAYVALDKEGTQILSYSRIFEITVSKDYELYAIYTNDGGEERPSVALTDLYTTQNGYVKMINFLAQHCVPKGYEIIQHGVLYSFDTYYATQENDFKLDAMNVYTIQAEESANTQYGSYLASFNMSDNTNREVSARGYLVVKNLETGKIEYVYGNVLKGSYTSLSN